MEPILFDRMPSGWSIAGYAEPSAIMDTAGTIWLTCPFSRSGVSRTKLFRKTPTSNWEEMPMPIEGFRGSISGGIPMIALYDSDTARVFVWQPPVIWTSATPTMPQQAIDGVARDMANVAMLSSDAALKKVESVHNRVEGMDASLSILSARIDGAMEVVTNGVRKMMEEIAWQKAKDALAEWWNKSVDYKEQPQLQNLLWNMNVKFRRWVLHNPGKEPQVNPDEKLRM